MSQIEKECHDKIMILEDQLKSVTVAGENNSKDINSLQQQKNQLERKCEQVLVTAPILTKSQCACILTTIVYSMTLAQHTIEESFTSSSGRTGLESIAYKQSE